MFPIDDIEIKELNITDLVPDLLEHFNRYQEVTYVWRIINGEKTMVKNPFVERWDNSLKREIVSEDLTNCVNSGGVIYAAFHDNKLIAFASVPLDFFGNEKQYLQLMQLHVSCEYRGLGLGRRLFCLCANKAKELGAKKLYISTHSSVESQAFYQAVGCVDALEINQKLAEHEPYDFQLEYSI